MNTEKFSWRKRIKSFRYAFRGLGTLLESEHNARIHLVAAVGVVAAGCFFGLSAGEWIAVSLAIGAVFAAEAFNSAVEALADLVSPDYHPLIKRAKDLSAGAVLCMALAAAAVGLIVFLPKLSALVVR